RQASLYSSKVGSHRTLRKRCMSQPWSDNHLLLQPETMPQHYGESEVTFNHHQLLYSRE
ncbi:unnamed protein product, partial [Brassica oleracea]